MKITAFVDPREAVATLVDRNGETMAGVSRFLGRSPRYLDRFVRDGVPSVLPARERHTLARYFGADVRDFGATETDNTQ